MTDTLKTVQALVDALESALHGLTYFITVKGDRKYLHGVWKDVAGVRRALIAQMQREAVQPVARQFDPKESLGAQPPAEIAAYLRSIGDHEAAAQFDTLAAALHPEAQALDSQLQQPDADSTRASGVCASTTPLPCPFCGTEPRVVKRWDESHYSHNAVQFMRIVCDECNAESMDSEDHDEVLAAWNRRSAADAQQQDDHAGSPAPSAQAIHYPECWDTAAYPTLESALAEVYAAFRCTNEDTHPAPSAQSSKAALSDDERHTLMCAVENLRSVDRNAEAAFRIAHRIEAILARAGIGESRREPQA